MIGLNYTDVVRQIIREALDDKPRTHKFYVIERIKVMVSATLLHTKAVGRNRECHDGSKNVQRGARIVFSDSWKQLKHEFVMDAEGFITLRLHRPDVTAPCSDRRIEADQEKSVVVFCLLSETDFIASGEEVKGYAGYIRAFYDLQTEALGKGHHPFTVLYDHEDFIFRKNLGKLGSTTGSEARAMWAWHYFQDKFAGPRMAQDGQKGREASGKADGSSSQKELDHEIKVAEY